MRFRAIFAPGIPIAWRPLVAQPLVHVHPNPDIAGTFRKCVRAGAFVGISPVRIGVAAVLLDPDSVIINCQCAFDNHHGALLDDFVCHVPSVQAEHLIQTLDHVDYFDGRKARPLCIGRDSLRRKWRLQFLQHI